MGYIDLHVHSNASDGTLTPAEVVKLAASQGLDAIALTDHDTTAGLETAELAAVREGIELVPGIEFSCVYQKTEIHILGLFIHKEEAEFASEIGKLQEIRERRNKEMISRFQEDAIAVTEDDLRAGNPQTVITRAHFARVLVKKGYASSLDQAFKRYLQYGGRYCLRKERITPEHAMAILVKNHAFPSLAHIMQYKLGWEENRRMILYLKALGLKGLEVYHSSHNSRHSQQLLELAGCCGLLPTGGSDFHGANKPDIQIGWGRGRLRLPYSMLDQIKEQL